MKPPLKVSVSTFADGSHQATQAVSPQKSLKSAAEQHWRCPAQFVPHDSAHGRLLRLAEGETIDGELELDHHQVSSCCSYDSALAGEKCQVEQTDEECARNFCQEGKGQWLLIGNPRSAHRHGAWEETSKADSSH